MLEVGLWHQGLIVWQLILIEATLPVVAFMTNMMKSFPEEDEAESIDSAFFISDASQSHPPLSLKVFARSRSITWR